MNQYNQDVNINFQGEDGLSNVVDKVNERLGSLQLKIFLANGALNTFGKRIITNADELAKFTKVLGVADVAFNKVFAVTGIVKVFTILGTGIADAKDKLDGLNIGLKAMQVSGYDTTIITQFTQLSDAILFNKDALDNFSLSALTAFNRFNKAKTEVATLFPENDPFIANLSSSIQKLVNEDLKNAVTSIDALRASYEAASSGFTEAADNQAVMVAGLKLAKAGGADTSATMKVLAQTISAYGLSASDSTKVAALLNKTVQLGVTTIPELSNGFAQAAVTASAAKVKLEELAASVSALTQQGFDTNSALTGIESLSRVIISKTPQATAALRELRDESTKPIKFDIAEIKTKGLTKALQDLNVATKGNVSLLREIIPESTAYNAALALMANNAERLEGFSEQMFDISKSGETARKALDAVFGIKLNNQIESFDAIVNRLTEQFIQFGEQLAPFFDTGVKAVENFTKLLAGISPEMKQMIASVLLSQLAFNKLNDVVGSLLGTATKAFIAYQGWRVTMMFMNGTIGEQFNLVSGLVKTNAGLVPIIKQIIGLDQSHLLIQTELNTVTKTKGQLLKDILSGDGDRLSNLKELVGLDKQYALNTTKLSKSLEGKNLILENQVDKVKGVIKATDKLKEAEQASASIREQGLQLFDKLNNSIERELDSKVALTKLTKDLKDAELLGDGDSIRKLQQESINLNREHSSSIKDQLDIKNEISKKEIEYANSLKVSNDAQVAVDNVRLASKNRLAVVTAKQLEVETLEANVIVFNTKAVKLQTAAEYLRTKAKFDSVNASVFLQRAEFLETKSTEYATKAKLTEAAVVAGNVEVKKLSAAASLAEAVADGTLIKVKTALGVSYIQNSILTKILFYDITRIGGATTFASGALAGFGATGSAAFTFVGATANAALTMINAQLTALYVKLAPFALALVPIAAALGLIAAVGYDAFFGTSAQVRKLNDELEKLDKQEKKALEDSLDKLNTAGKLNYQQKIRLEQLRTESELVAANTDIYRDVWSDIGNNIVNATKAIFTFGNEFNILKILFDKGFENLRFQQLLPTLGKIDAAVIKTGDSIKDLTKSTKQLKEGFTGLEDVDKLIKAGKILDVNAITRIKNEADVRAKESELVIANNDNRINVLNDQLKKFDALGKEEQKQASEQDKVLATRRDLLSAKNDQLKQELTEAKEVTKARLEFETQRGILLKRVLDNNAEIEEGSNTKDEDKGVNALQTRLKKGLRLATEDLDNYRKQVRATLDGSMEYLDDQGNKVKVDVTKMTDYLQTFDASVDSTIGSIDQLYQTNYINGTEAAMKLKAVLDVNKSEMDIGTYITAVNQSVGYMKEGSKQTIELLGLEGETRRAMLDSGVTSTRETNAEIRKLNKARLEEEIKQQLQLIEFTKDTSGEDQKKLDAAKLKLLQQQLAADNRASLKTELEDRFKEQQVALDKETGLLKLNKAKRLISEAEYNDQLATDSQMNLDLKREQLNKELELNKNDIDKRKVIQNELTNIEIQQQDLITSNLERAINVRSKMRELALTKEQLLVTLNRSQYLTSEEESIADIEAVRKKEILNKQTNLNEQLTLVKNDKDKQAEIANQLLTLQLDYQKLVTEGLEREFAKRNKILENNSNKTRLIYKELSNVVDSNVASLNEENKIYESRNNLIKSTIDYESGTLTNSLRVTADIEKRAAIETRIVKLRESNRDITDAAERNSLINQQKSIELALQKQQIELDSRRNEANSNSKLLQLELERAVKRKLNAEDIDAIKIKLDANKQEQDSITKQNDLLQVTKRNQQEIVVNSNKELENRQAIAREGGLLDLQIAKQNEVLAKYEKAAQLANIEATIAETTANKQQVAADVQIKSYETRLEMLNKQAQLEQQNQEQVQRQFTLAQDLAVNDNQKRKLAEQAAKQELLNLGKKQQIEQQVLEINIKSNRLALQRSIIEQEVAKIKLAAEIKVQEAETNKVLASKTSTDEEKQGSLATLDAKKFALVAKQYEDVFLQQKEQLLAADESIQRSGLNTRQRNEQQDKTVAYAKSTFTTADDRAIYRALKDSLTPLTNVLDTIKIDRGNFANLFSYQQQQSVNLEASKFDFKLGQPRVNKTNDGKQVVINFTPTTNIEVKGDGSTAEFGKQLKAESDSWIKGLHDTLRKVNVELGR